MLDQITKPEKLTWILFAIVVIALYLFALDIPLLGPDESRYSQVAREMYERGDWVTTTLGGFNWFEKPALLYWLQITFYSLFGVSEFSARLGSALFGLGTVGSLFVLGRYFTQETKSANSEFPFWLALIAASSIGLVAFSRGASFDIIITFPITAALVSFFVWEMKNARSDTGFFHPCLLAFYFFIGIALIAKGLIGIVFPFAIVSFYYLLKWKFPGKVLLASLFWGTVFSVLVASIWYLPMYLTNGWEFIDEFFIQHHFKRFSSNKYLHPQPFWFFWIVLPAMTVPWIPFFFASLWKFGKNFLNLEEVATSRENKSQIAKYELRLFAFAWMLVPLIFFSMSGSKLPGYILPSLPAACILTAGFVNGFVQKNRMRKFLLQGLALTTFTVFAFLLQFALPKFAVDDSIKGLVTSANESGYATEKILNFNTISHSAEFYGAKRLLREPDGKQKRFDTAAEIEEYMIETETDRSLILAPNQFEKDLNEKGLLTIKKLANNREHAIFLVERK